MSEKEWEIVKAPKPLGSTNPCKGCGRDKHNKEQCLFKGHNRFNQSNLEFNESESGKIWLSIRVKVAKQTVMILQITC